MPLFALPLSASAVRPSTREVLYVLRGTKRKRLSSPEGDGDIHDDVADAVPIIADEEPSISAAISNPLSLTPNEVQQYRAAGLELDQELPSKIYADFPHRPLPDSHFVHSSTDDDHRPSRENDLKDRSSLKGRPHLRIHHLGVLTGILHRCLLEGDIERASRAWALLLRGQVNGRGIDLRNSGYWGIGAELLMLSGDRQQGRPSIVGSDLDEGRDHAEEDDGQENSNEDNDAVKNIAQEKIATRRWGTSAGSEQVKKYYERLILQYPTRRQPGSSTSALDFWPSMIACELYGIHSEQEKALLQLDQRQSLGDFELSDAEESEVENPDTQDEQEFFIAQEKKEVRQSQREQENIWKQRESIRKKAFAAAQDVAARLVELMIFPPFSDSGVLLRLKGMLALYVGDLAIPTPISADGSQNDNGDDDNVSADRRMKLRQRRVDLERGRSQQSDQYRVAQEAFKRVLSESQCSPDAELLSIMRRSELEKEDSTDDE